MKEKYFETQLLKTQKAVPFCPWKCAREQITVISGNEQDKSKAISEGTWKGS